MSGSPPSSGQPQPPATTPPRPENFSGRRFWPKPKMLLILRSIQSPHPRAIPPSSSHSRPSSPSPPSTAVAFTHDTTTPLPQPPRHHPITTTARTTTGCYKEDFKDYTACEPEPYRSDLLKYLDTLDKFIDKRETEKPLNEAIPHEHEIEKSFKMQSKDVQINPVHAVDANLVVTESSGTKSDKQDTSSRSGNYTTHAMDAYIRLVNDQEPFAKVDSNTTLDSTNMSNRGGEID
ncbi:hypothetical protein Tco_1440038 [Tanacetum coccineum]